MRHAVPRSRPVATAFRPGRSPWLLTALILLSACASSGSRTDRAYATVDDLFRAYHEFRLRINPVEATKAGENEYNDTVANFISDDYRAELLTEYGRFLDAIDSFEGEPLSRADRLSLRVMRWDSEIKKQGLQSPIVTVASPMFDLPAFQLMPVNQIFSFHLYFGQLASGASVQPFRTVEDYDDWTRRVGDYVEWVDTAIANMKVGVERGIVLPKVIVERMIGQLDGMITNDLAEHIYYEPIENLPDSIPSAERERLSAAFAEMIRERVDPAHARLRDYLRGEYLAAAGDHSGIGALPGGPETYQHLIRYHTSTEMTAEEIFALGEREVARISREMEEVKERLGFEGDLRAFFAHVREHPDLMPFTEPSQVIAHFEAIHERMKPRLARLFAMQPRAGFEVRRTEAFREASASAEYVPGTKDGSRPGVFYVPIPEVREYNTVSDESLFLHEAIPGHHYQLSLQQENEDLPEFLHAEGMGVFVEGWALYSESLGRELGLYDDPYQYFGMLSAEMHRAIRLVVDTGMHAKGWTREQAIEYSLAHEAESEAAITAEIERYMVAPGQALSYKIGQLQIRDLRRRSEEALGERFDLREFHRQVLGSGSLPLVLLEEKIDNWIAETRNAGA